MLSQSLSCSGIQLSTIKSGSQSPFGKRFRFLFFLQNRSCNFVHFPY
ncbi:hypothetical protein HMPREF1548_04292 [Clostridium sp. KLE 1755]|nr:hypothetical protein HMPREF1548_04292 [Clostridium sp. KLE 1755]